VLNQCGHHLPAFASTPPGKAAMAINIHAMANILPLHRCNDAGHLRQPCSCIAPVQCPRGSGDSLHRCNVTNRSALVVDNRWNLFALSNVLHRCKSTAHLITLHDFIAPVQRGSTRHHALHRCNNRRIPKRRLVIAPVQQPLPTERIKEKARQRSGLFFYAFVLREDSI